MSTTTPRAPSFIESFPDNFTWTNATLVCKGMAPYGVVALEEIERVVQRLRARSDEPAAWWEEWGSMAGRLKEAAERAAAENRQLTAGHCYLRAGYYYFTGERFIPPGEDKLAMYERALRCFQAGFERRFPEFQRVEVPYEGTALPAYFLAARDAQAPAPTVVLFDGLDNCKEMSIVFAGLEFREHGFNTLAVDGPGMGEALRWRHLHGRYDYEVAGTAAYDYVASLPGVDPGRVVVMGYSFGGYYAPRIAAFEKRYAGAVSLGAMHWDLAAAQSRTKQALAAAPHTVSQSPFQFTWVLGAADLEEAIEMAKQFDLGEVAKRVECPFLVTHGGNDRLTPPSSAEALYDAIASPRKTIKIFTTEEGGAEHCHVDNRQVGIDFVADWIAANV